MTWRVKFKLDKHWKNEWRVVCTSYGSDLIHAVEHAGTLAHCYPNVQAVKIEQIKKKGRIAPAR